MTGPLSVARPPSRSMLSALRDRMADAGWQHRRDPLNGREEWMEPALPPGQREPRSVRVDELFRGASGFVVEGCNGHERLLLRCVPDTDPQVVLVTLDLWRILPDQAATRRPAEAVSAGA
ncbi:hypothetical protein AB0873_14830 [Micromonospora sp. NPDC047707]|uniref:hypothetical protein n=1 Tax=Micromonospora sp. NPDC047707 TaxID=3154498 RepID=UPI003452D896